MCVGHTRRGGTIQRYRTGHAVVIAVIVHWAVLVGTFAAGLGTIALIARLWHRRDRPGATWFLASLSAQTLWCLAYGSALLVDTYGLRLALEMLSLVAMPWTGVLYFGFTLGYTGRGHLLDRWQYRLPLAGAALSTLFILTNPLHHLVFQSFTLVEIGPLVGANYTHEPGLFLVFGMVALPTVLAAALLFDTVLSYGTLFRGESLAVGASAIPPGVALVLWMFEVVPPTALNFTPLMFLPHVILDAYAFVERDMFEFLPGTLRTGEQAAVRDLGTPVAIVDTESRVVALNEAGQDLAGTSEQAALTRPLSALLDTDIDPDAGEQRRTITADGKRREFAITPAALEDATGAPVGYTLVLQDITEDIEREQRLSVMNRVLRHNLRNDLNVVQGYVEESAEAVDDEFVTEMLQTAMGKTTGLVEMSQKVRDIEATITDASEQVETDLPALLRSVVEDCEDPDAVELSVPQTLAVQTSPELLALVVENLVENALEHGDPPVGVAAARDAETVSITVSDEGAGIPEHELSAIEQDTETDLVHGSGIGLWLVDWSVGRLGGTVAFDTGDSGTTAEITLPCE